MDEFSENISSNSRIAKNTLFLYLRSFITMGLGLYTTRLILQVLGVEDYGVQALAATVVSMFSFIQTPLIGAIGRFLNFELGKKDYEAYRRIFSFSLIALTGLALLIAILSETFGPMLLHKAKIPIERMDAAVWIFHGSVASICLAIVAMAYDSVITSHEKFSFFAYTSLTVVVLKLILIVVLSYATFDKLKIYAFFDPVLFFILLIINKLYCNHKLKTAFFKWDWDSTLFKQLMKFSGWTFLGSFAAMGAGTGVNYIMNAFHGVVINASMGVAANVNNILSKLTGNFSVAFRPQITKLYAAEQREVLRKLLYRASKFSFFIFMMIAFPLLLNIDFILDKWLDEVPDFAAPFCCIIVLCTMMDVVSNPFGTAINATGKIAGLQIWTTSAYLGNILFAWIFLLMGINPIYVAGIRLAVFGVSFINRSYYLNKNQIMSYAQMFKNILLPVLTVTVISIPAPLILHHYLSQWQALFAATFVYLLFYLPSVYYFGFTQAERIKVLEFVKKKLKRN